MCIYRVCECRDHAPAQDCTHTHFVYDIYRMCAYGTCDAVVHIEYRSQLVYVDI